MTRPNSRRFAVPVVCVLASVLSGVACAQTLSLNTPTLNFTVLSGGFAKQQLSLNTTASTTAFTNVTGAPSWLSVNPAGPVNVFQGTPTTLNVVANAAGLAVGFTQTGTFTIGLQSGSGTPLTVTVNLTVAGPTALTSNPTSLSFTVPLGTPAINIAAQQVIITSSVGPLAFAATQSTQDGNNWLIPFTTTGNTGTAPSINIGVNPGSLPAGVYHGTLFIQSTSSSDSVAIPVTMTVTQPASLSVTPATLQPFLFQTGTTPQTGQLTRTLMVSSSSVSAAFTAAVTSFNPPSAQSWLVVSPPNGATGAGGAAVPVTLTATPGQLAPGVYTAQVALAVVGGVALPPIPVSLVISNNPLLQLSNNILSFSSNFGATTPPAMQSVQITTLGTGSTSFTFSSDSPWLTAASATVTTPATLNISVNPTGLAVGTLTGTITVKPTGGDTNLYSLPIAVTLTIGNTTTLTAGPPLLVFSQQTGQPAPTSQLVQLMAAGQSTTFSLATSTVTAANCPANWLSASASTNSVSSVTPAVITVTPTTTNMTAGICSGSITVTYPGSGTTPVTLTIPVTVNVNASTLLTINMPLGFGQFAAIQNGPTLTSSITVGSTDGTPVAFTVTSTSNGSPWLSVSSNGPSTPQVLQVQIVPGNLPPNTYSGSITIASPNLPAGQITIPVVLTVNPTVAVTLSNAGPLNFTQGQGGAVPPAQSITITSTGGTANFQISVSSSSTCSWLQVSPLSGTTNGAVVTFTPLANTLPQNTYLCPVTFSFLGASTAPIVVNAVLTVGPLQTVSVNQQSLSFAYQVGGTAPASQPIIVSSTGGAVSFTVGTTSSGGWLTTDAGTGALATPKTINISIIPANIPTAAAGTTIQGSIVITAPNVLTAPITIPVSLTVTAAAVPTPIIILNSATNAVGNGIAPGELIAIKGINLGPATPVAGTSFTPTAQGTVSDTLAGVKVSFSGINGTPIYVSATQINVVVPWEMAGRTTATMVVSYNSADSAGISLSVVSAAPGVYTLTATGVGQAAGLNEPIGTVNGPTSGVQVVGGTIPTSPAAQGSIIAIYGTGGGLTSPGGVDGTLNSGVTLMPLLNWTFGSSVVTASVGGKPAVVNFAGAAPTLITGVWQINITLPAGLSSGAQTLDIAINGQHTQANVTVNVQ